MNDMKVWLKPHTGFIDTPVGKVEVEHDQYYVFYNGHHVGYVGKADNAPLNFVLALPQQLIDEIKAKTEAIKGTIGGVGVPPSEEEIREAFGDEEEDDDTD